MKNKKYPAVFLALLVCAANSWSQAPKRWEDEAPDLSYFDNVDFRFYLPGSAASKETAIKLNTLGFEAYNRDELTKACALFKCSLDMYSDFAYSHYNYAAVLAIFAQAFGDGFTGEFSGPTAFVQVPDLEIRYWEAIFFHLKTSIRLDAGRLKRSQEDSDFNTIHGSREYRFMLLGRNASPESVLHMESRYYKSSPGAYPVNENIVFTRDYQVTYSPDTQYQEMLEMENGPTGFEAAYSVSGSEIRIKLSGTGGAIKGRIEVYYDDLRFVAGSSITIDGYGQFIDEYAKRIDSSGA